MVVWNARAVTPQEEMLPFIRPMRGPQVGKSACIVLAKERHSKGERVPLSALS